MTTKPTKPRKTTARRGSQPPINYAAIDLLRSWRNASEEELREQQETWEYLKKALDEDRTSSRKLFP